MAKGSSCAARCLPVSWVSTREASAVVVLLQENQARSAADGARWRQSGAMRAKSRPWTALRSSGVSACLHASRPPSSSSGRAASARGNGGACCEPAWCAASKTWVYLQTERVTVSCEQSERHTHTRSPDGRTPAQALKKQARACVARAEKPKGCAARHNINHAP